VRTASLDLMLHSSQRAPSQPSYLELKVQRNKVDRVLLEHEAVVLEELAVALGTVRDEHLLALLVLAGRVDDEELTVLRETTGRLTRGIVRRESGAKETLARTALGSWFSMSTSGTRTGPAGVPNRRELVARKPQR